MLLAVLTNGKLCLTNDELKLTNHKFKFNSKQEGLINEIQLSGQWATVISQWINQYGSGVDQKGAGINQSWKYFQSIVNTSIVSINRVNFNAPLHERSKEIYR